VTLRDLLLACTCYRKQQNLWRREFDFKFRGTVCGALTCMLGLYFFLAEKHSFLLKLTTLGFILIRQCNRMTGSNNNNNFIGIVYFQRKSHNNDYNNNEYHRKITI